MRYKIYVKEYITDWFKNGLYHRKDGSAMEYANGNKSWVKNGKFHRLDGPAVEYADDSRIWWIDGRRYTEEEFNKENKSGKK